jgi:asparagine synthase (glutamine-hydrolysing)
MEIKIGSEPIIRSYWDLNPSQKVQGSIEEYASRLLELVKESTAIRMIADVPLGAFLSGGIDSSAVVGVMSELSTDRVKTCSIGFQDKAHDETPYSREVAKLFSTDHREFFVKGDLTDTVRLLPRYFDEPFADSSSVPTYHVARLARQLVKVALAGDGGDEGFGGYEKYRTELYENMVRRFVPKPLLSLLHACTTGQGCLVRKIRTLTRSGLSDSAKAFYHTNTFITDEELSLLLADNVKADCRGYDPSEHTTRYWNRLQGEDHVSRMLYTDIKTFLPGDILVKVDRMSMANSLEVRAPLLDYRILEFAASLPSSWKIKGIEKKYILKKAFAKVLPKRILHRKKHGFTVPLDHWFRNGLRDLGSAVLFNDERLGQYFSSAFIRRIWELHQSRKANYGILLWTLLSFGLWDLEYI